MRMGSEKESHKLHFLVGIVFFLSFASIACCCYLLLELSDLRRELDALPVITHESKLDSTTTVKSDEGAEKTKEFWKSLASNAQHEGAQVDHGSRKKRQSEDECGGTFYISRNSTQTYTFSTPNYPLDYENRLWCNWTFVLEFPKPEAYKGSRSLEDVGLQLSFIGGIEIEFDNNCRYDYLKVYGGGKGVRPLANLCGTRSNVSKIEFYGPIVAEFKTDESVTKNGFRAQVSVIRKERAGDGDNVLWESILSLLRQTGGKDAMYTSWGTAQCATGLPIYDGWAVGLKNLLTNQLQCMPFPSDITFNDTAYVNIQLPTLTPPRFSLGFGSTAFRTDVGGKLLRCAQCHALRNNAFTVFGWSSCNTEHGWDTAYSGVVVVSGVDDLTLSDPICVHRAPEVSNGYGTEEIGPYLLPAKSGDGLWIKDRIVPCAVCVRKTYSAGEDV